MYPFFYRRVLVHLDPERAHTLAVDFLRVMGASAAGRAVLRRLFAPRPDPRQVVEVWGIKFPHVLGLAGGFDKRAECLPGLAALGFGHVEIGTITPRPQPGNPRPRVFRLPEDQALINRMGFPGDGAAAARAHLERTPRLIPVAVSLGKNKETALERAAEDYCEVLNTLHPYGDFFTLNISSPNTPELRRLQTPAYLSELLGAVQTTMKRLSPKPLLIKIAPDLTWADIDTILDLALQHQIAGIVATNTTLSREGLHSPAQSENGGLSGLPLRERSTVIIRYIRDRIGDKLGIIGVGGIFNHTDLQQKLDAGAVLVQAYTGFIYRGMGFVKQCLRP